MHHTSRSSAVLSRVLGRFLSEKTKSQNLLPPVILRKLHHATEKNVIVSSNKHVQVPNALIFDYVWANMDRWADKTAAVCGITGRGYTFDQAYKMTRAFAACLRSKLKIRDGDVFAIMLPNLPEYPLATIGALQAGCVVTLMNPIYTSVEIANQLINSDTKVIVTLSSTLNTVRQAIKDSKRDIKIIVCTENGEATPEGTIKFAEFAENFQIDTDCLKEVKRRPEDVAFLPYSSGTTGLPKGVMLSHKNIIANIEQLHAGKVPIFKDTTDTYQESIPCVLPFYHIYGLTVLLLSKLYLGFKMVTLPKFSPDTFLAAQEKYKGTILHVVPPIVIFLALHPHVGPKHLDSVHTIVSGAAPLAASDVLRFSEKCRKNMPFLQGYGLTETSPVVLLLERGIPRYASVGGPVSNTECKIVSLDGSNTALGANEEGELWVRGPQVMMGYHNNEKATQDVLAPGGWFKTGDLGYFDDDDHFYITDRLKELIKVKGYPVAPAELEGLLRNHPALSDAAVVGIPDQKSGEVPKAFVIAKKDKTVTEADVIDYLVDKVANYKMPSAVQFVTEIPKSAAGKILRRELKNMYL